MADLSLDLNKISENYRDLLVLNGDLTLTSDVNENGTNPVLQNIIQNLSFFLGEWFLDNTQGIPWFQQILVKGTDSAVVDAIIKNTIMATPGVQTLTSYSFSINTAFRTATISFSVLTSTGTVSYSGNVSVGGSQ